MGADVLQLGEGIDEPGEREVLCFFAGETKSLASLPRHLHAKPKRTLDGHLPIAERRIVKNLRLLGLLTNARSGAI